MNHIYLHSLHGEKISLLNPNCCIKEKLYYVGYMLFPSVMGGHFMLPRKQVILVIHSRFIALHVHGSTYSLTIIVNTA